LKAVSLAKIEQQKQIQLENIQKNKEAALERLDKEYETWDKAKRSFGYIGISFLVFIFSSIFGNDFIKLCIYLCNGLREWWRRRRNIQHQNENENLRRREAEERRVQIELERVNADLLEKKLEKVYFKLVEVNAKNNRKIQTTQ
jgi:hypothetical protein